MCGIAGIVGGPDEAAWEGDRIHRMIGAIAHRGPDESHATRLGPAVLATARLALVDRPTSRQPMADPSARHLLSFNGEIYNHRELRSELEGLGVRFRTSGDTEVLLHTLIRWGVRGLRRLKGQFAVAWWDADQHQLVLARDRFGIVPLFWTRPGRDQLAFASEVKALKAGGFQPELSVRDLVDAGVLWGLHPGRSAFAGVRSVPPGGYVVLRGGAVREGRYWEFAFAEDRDATDVEDQARHLTELLEAAVARRVPQYGDPAVLLSGGLDSSAVLALLRGQQPESRIDSYSIQFTATALDEASFQALASERFRTFHTSITCDDASVADTLVRTIEHAEVPLVRTAPASSIHLAARIEQNRTRAVLSGEGADELLCGYDLFKVAAIRDAWSREPESPVWPRQLAAALRQQEGLGRAVERAFYEQGLDQRSDPLFSHLNRWSASFRITQYLDEDLRRQISLDQVYDGVRTRLPAAHRTWTAVEQAQYLEATYFLPSALLATQCDRPYMAHSIEARYPFLDEDVVDFALTLPLASKLHGSNEKYLLKTAMDRLVPREITERVKQPYTAPEGDVFRTQPGQDLLEAYLSAPALEKVGVFDRKRVEWLVRKLGSRRTSFHDDLALLWIVSTQVLADAYGVADPRT